MTQVSEGPNEQTQMHGALEDGYTVLSQNQEITFQAYTRVVLPVDGYVFWSPTIQIGASGSLHYSQEIQQNEDETVGFATVVFTSNRQITEFTDSPTNTIFVARVGEFRYAFSQQQGRYDTAGIWHYFGHSIYPALASQLLDRPDSIDPNRAVTSNSLALWLSLNTYKPIYDDTFTTGITLYPSFLTQTNLVPPYGTVHIEDTDALQSAPYIDSNSDHYQLVSDRVRVTLYGLQSNEALDFLDAVLGYSRDTNDFGIMNMPVPRDGKRTQTELEAIAMQKVIEFEVSYLQTRTNDVARQLILSALPTILIGD